MAEQIRCCLSECVLYMPVRVVHENDDSQNCCHFHKVRLLNYIAARLFSNNAIACPNKGCKKTIVRIELCNKHSDRKNTDLEKGVVFTPSAIERLTNKLNEAFESSGNKLTMQVMRELYKKNAQRRGSRRTAQLRTLHSRRLSPNISRKSSQSPPKEEDIQPSVTTTNDVYEEDDSGCVWKAFCNMFGKSGLGQVFIGFGALALVAIMSVGTALFDPDGGTRPPTTSVNLNGRASRIE